MELYKIFVPLQGMLLAAVALLAGCAGAPDEAVDENYGHIKFKPPDKVVYEEISSRNCELAVPVDLQVAAGTPGELELQLINHGRQEVIIKEWYMVDEYNFDVFYRRVPSDRPLAPETPYQKYSIRIPAQPQPRHAELQLKPGTRAMLTITLPFTGEVNPGENAIFEVYVATSLHTFKIRSKNLMVYTR